MNELKKKNLCVFTTYLTRTICPQRKQHFTSDTDSMFYSLMVGCTINDISLYVFHDYLNPAIQHQISSKQPNIRFIHVPENTTALSTNDYRFKIYLENFHYVEKSHTHVMFTDCGDVWIRENPINILSDNNNSLFVCHETNQSFSIFNNHYAKQLQGIDQYTTLDVSRYREQRNTPLNAGAWGGEKTLVKPILSEYVSLLESISIKLPHVNCNNILLNVLLKSRDININGDIFSPFKSYAFHDNSFYIYHK